MQDNDHCHTPTGGAELTVVVLRAMEGDRKAFEELIVMFQSGIYRMAYARIQSRADAEDLVQDVFLKAYRNISSLKSAEVFKAWLYRIAANSVKDYYRKRKFMSLFGFGVQESGDDCEYAGSDPDGYDHLASKQFWGRFNAFLQGLPRQQREVFRLRFLDHLNIAEISLVLGRSESAVKTHLYRAIEKFKTEGPSSGLFQEEIS